MQSNCALIGGETAEMPSMYNDGEYDIAGFCVGAVEKSKLITGENISDGDIIIGLNSSGVHSNGFSLVRKIINDNKLDLAKVYDEYFTNTLGEVLLTPTTIYVRAVLKLLETIAVKGMCHITGGGFYENVPRMFINKQLGASFNKASLPQNNLFKFLQHYGNVGEHEMFNVFNMGIGFMVVIDKKDVEQSLHILNEFHQTQVIGSITNKVNISID